MSPVVAIIGRPNVGKSTLFNRLIGKKIAIVDNMPGVTRDRKEGDAQLGDLSFKIIDTAGLEEGQGDTMEAKMLDQTMRAIKDADILLMMIDARQGVTPMDEHFAKMVRKSGKPIILLANKCENSNVAATGAGEAYRLGLGDPVAISSEHGIGMAELYDAIMAHVKLPEDETIEDEPTLEENKDEIMNIAIVGRPNVGKSTLLNQLLGEERAIVSPVAGTTRDAIAVLKEINGRQLKIIDTAGMRKKANVIDKVEKMSVKETLHALQLAHVVVLMLDGTLGIEKQDLTIADMVIREGRCLIIAVNKWDIVTDKEAKLADIKYRLELSLPQAKGLPILTISAMKGKKTEKIIEEAFKIYEVWNKRIPTGQLNKWLEGVINQHTPPLVRGKRLKIRYLTQVSTRPPRFALFTNFLPEFPESYLRYMTNSLRDTFDLHGVPIRLFPRNQGNPFADKE